jgi:uncharacterized protein
LKGSTLAHTRKRHLAQRLSKLAKLWPAIGLVGPRQSGKTTLMREQLDIENSISLDEEDVRADALASAKAFLARQSRPVLIDEIQKVPKLFDAIKSEIDKKRIPGQYYLTGSSQFSNRLDIRESLTGRIGLVQLYPLTIGEAHSQPVLHIDQPIRRERKSVTFDTAAVTHHMMRGGMPIPMFLREKNMFLEYWRGWLDTTIYRDLALFFKRTYDPEFAFRILKAMAKCMKNGELPTIQNLEGSNLKLKSYLDALQLIFVIKRIPIHEQATGRDAYLFFDSGFANFMMGQEQSEGVSLTLARHFIWQETSAYLSTNGIHDDRTYFKSARGSPVDMIWNDVAIKISHKSERNAWDERALAAAMKSLDLKNGLMVAPVDQIQIPKGGGIGRVPWGYWS